MKSEQRKKEDCELLDAFGEYYKAGTLNINGSLRQFKTDNDLLPKNVSGWYLSHSFNSWCAYSDFENQIIYGIDATGEWFRRNLTDNEIDQDDYLATKKQVKERLFPFFEKMGYKKKQAKCLTSSVDCRLNLSKAYFTLNSSNELYVRNKQLAKLNMIMKDGILAELIEETETERLKD